MRTKLTIVGILAAVVLAAIGIVVGLVVWLGPWVGFVATAGAAAAVVLVYVTLVGPWHRRWGATTQEARRTMPGDAVIPGAASTTRAITIAASPREIWPWLAQIGYGRAGWYSYDWIDNDGHPSATRVRPEWQEIRVGDLIQMMPGFGPRVREVEPNSYLLAGDEEGGTWCLALYRVRDGTRLVSRWRQRWHLTPATFLWIMLADPGAFIMERKMLRGVKARAERAQAPPSAHPAHRRHLSVVQTSSEEERSSGQQG